MADIKYSQTQAIDNTDITGTELVSLSVDTSAPSAPGSETWADRAITLDELKVWINT